MFLFKCPIGIGLISSRSIRCFSLSASHNKSKNHYDSLGLTPKATQSDIKTAYYKLSMQYHPDKNKGSETAAESFRDITAAYEILGNLKLRKLYDKGILHTAGPQYAQQEDDDMQMEDDAQRGFYQSRERRAKPPTPTGRSPIYNFDEWTRAHYGASFARRAEAKARYERTESLNISNRDTIRVEIIFLLLCGFITMFGIAYIRIVDYDAVEETADTNKKKSQNSILQKM